MEDIKKYIIADMHTHSIFSQHAYSTIKENIEIAKLNNLKYIAITDHFFNSGTDIENKNETNRITCLEERINRLESDIYVIGGAEFNLHQEIPYWNDLQNIIWRPIGLHSWFIDIEGSSLEDIYQEFEKASSRHNVFNHIERELFRLENYKYQNENELCNDIKYFLKNMCLLAKNNDIFLEVNESSIVTNTGGALDRLKFWLSIAKENRNLICIGSDAHYCQEVGNFSNVCVLLNEIEYPKELIINCNEGMIKSLKRI